MCRSASRRYWWCIASRGSNICVRNNSCREVLHVQFFPLIFFFRRISFSVSFLVPYSSPLVSCLLFLFFPDFTEAPPLPPCLSLAAIAFCLRLCLSAPFLSFLSFSSSFVTAHLSLARIYGYFFPVVLSLSISIHCLIIFRDAFPRYLNNFFLPFFLLSSTFSSVLSRAFARLIFLTIE